MGGVHVCITITVIKMSEALDPKVLAENECNGRCASQWAQYNACAQRISNDKTGEKNCSGQYFDVWKCIDQCVRSTSLFSLLFLLILLI
jgi:ubiquinol-cytochrome c reductase subunit 6